MKNGWLTKVGKFTVEHVKCPHPGIPVDPAAAPKAVQHTTEGRTVEGALAVFCKKYAPHFTVGRDVKGRVRVIQHVPLGMMSTALAHTAWPPTNGWARVQIELVAFRKLTIWRPDPEVSAALGALYGALAQAQQIPLTHAPNPKRDPQVWAKGSGWFGHDGVPQNDHSDPGRLDYDFLFALASRGLPSPPPKPRPKPIVLHPKTYRLRRRANGIVYVEEYDRPN